MRLAPGFNEHSVCGSVQPLHSLPGGMSGLLAAALPVSVSSPCWQTVTPLAQHSSGTPQPCHRFGGVGPAVRAALVHGAACFAGCGAWGTCLAAQHSPVTAHAHIIDTKTLMLRSFVGYACVQPHACIISAAAVYLNLTVRCAPPVVCVWCAVSAYVTHGVFPRESWKKFKADNGGEARAAARRSSTACAGTAVIPYSIHAAIVGLDVRACA
jgi:hypothetical protein